MKALLCAILLCSTAQAQSYRAMGNDYVYVYGSPNITYRCAAILSYFDTTGSSVYYADSCQKVSEDSQQWPPFPQQDIRVSLDFVSAKVPRFFRDCQFVAHAQNLDRTTSTVIDCR